MTTDFSLRQVLACLNISVFDPLVEPALKKACRISREQQDEKNDPFSGAFFVAAMVGAALAAFVGLRSYAFSAGLFLVIFTNIGLCYSTGAGGRFFFRTYLLCSVFLLADGLFQLSAWACIAMLFVLLLFSSFSAKGMRKRALLSVLFFVSCVYGAFENEPSVVMDLLAVFSILGAAGLLFPVKNIYWREQSVVFLVLPVALVFGHGIFVLSSGEALLSSGTMLSAMVVGVQMLMLLFCLRKDLESGELLLFCMTGVALFFVAALLSPGLAGAVVLFLLAFFTDMRLLGRTAAVLFSGCLIVFFLSLPISLFEAGVVCLLSCLFFGVFYVRLNRFLQKENA